MNLDSTDGPRIARAVTELLAAIGDDPQREGIRDTPGRVAEMYAGLFAGLTQHPRDVLTSTFDEQYDEMVVARDIHFYSMCEHHLLPFFGVAHIGYLPRGQIVGISKLARLVEMFARRPQVQERMTTQIADALLDGIDPLGVGVVIRAEHLCLGMRGVQKPGATIVTSVNRGCFREDSRTRAEFLTLCGIGLQ